VVKKGGGSSGVMGKWEERRADSSPSSPPRLAGCAGS